MKKTAKTDEEKEFVDTLNRGRGNVADFVRTTFYKRMSSCGHSFTLSLQRHIARNELFGYAIDNGLRIQTGTIVDTSLTDDDGPTASDLDTAESLTDDPGRRHEALVASNPAAVTWIRPELFTAEVRNDLDRGTTALHALLKSYGGWEVATYSKLDALIKLLIADHPADKVLVFTEYKHTANYIAAALREAGIPAVRSAAAESTTRTITSGTSRRLAEAACGESFGNLARWEESMLDFPAVSCASRAVGVFELPDDLRVLDLDDPAQLVWLGCGRLRS